MKKPGEDMIFKNLAESISHLACELREAREQRRNECDWTKSLSGLASKCDLVTLEQRIMSALSDYVGEVNKSFDEVDAALETSNSKLAGITDDVAYLKETIDKINTNPGPITPEDQALLDGAKARAAAAATKLTAFKTALEALDAATERPVPPPVEPPV